MEFQPLFICILYLSLNVVVAGVDLSRVIDTIGKYSKDMIRNFLNMEKFYVDNGIDDFSLDSAAHQLEKFSLLDTEAAREAICGYFSIQSAKKFRALNGKKKQSIKAFFNQNKHARKLWKFYAKRYCPPTKPVSPCSRASKYRTMDGSCNNLRQMTWGMAHTPQRRFLKPAYSDGCDSPRDKGVYCKPLPSTRLVSNKLHNPGKRTKFDRQLTVMHMTWGQFLDHDVVLTPMLKGKDGANIQCCGLKKSRPECFPISIPRNDPHFRKETCMNLVRSSPASPRDIIPGCREQLNSITSYIDASMVYGSSVKEMKKLRSFKHGKLKVKKGNELPGDRKRKGCVFKDRQDHCPFAGDVRVNEVPSLSGVHFLFVREHNRLAKGLHELNPNWDDEKIFQEVRKIIGGIIQHITYSEYLPLVLGENIMLQYGLNPTENWHHGDYNKDVDASVRNVFGAAAFRFGHSQITNHQARKNVYYRTVESARIENSFFHTHMCTHGKGTACEGVLRWEIDAKAAKVDGKIEKGVRDRLFLDKKGKSFDLGALNAQRGRDHGIPPYVRWRRWCGLSFGRYRWRDHSRRNRRILEKLYSHYSDIDLFPAAISEIPVHGGIVGPTFACILARQFSLLKTGDRFWYENDLHPTGFSIDQLHAIKEMTLSTIICNNIKMKRIQKRAFERAGYRNRRRSCRHLRPLDLEPWIDDHRHEW